MKTDRIVRMENEIRVLEGKCRLIREYAKTPRWAKVGELNRSLMRAQVAAMNAYAGILRTRLELAKASAAGSTAKQPVSKKAFSRDWKRKIR